MQTISSPASAGSTVVHTQLYYIIHFLTALAAELKRHLCKGPCILPHGGSSLRITLTGFSWTELKCVKYIAIMAICGHCAQCAGLLWPSVLVCSVWPWWPCGHAGNGDCVPPCHRSLRSSRQPALSSGTQPAEPPASWQYTAQPPLCVFVEMVKLAVQKKVCNGALSPLVAAAG